MLLDLEMLTHVDSRIIVHESLRTLCETCRVSLGSKHEPSILEMIVTYHDLFNSNFLLSRDHVQKRPRAQVIVMKVYRYQSEVSTSFNFNNLRSVIYFIIYQSSTWNPNDPCFELEKTFFWKAKQGSGGFQV